MLDTRLSRQSHYMADMELKLWQGLAAAPPFPALLTGAWRAQPYATKHQKQTQ